ncbi:MAG: S8 family serine peptidase [Candidatus Eisenbacteria bacterium]|uniref:S8 family serine peptidase n=1 Tax=Eiseniibacteriota bacterium TaxID=2212470 RepID=A0A7Y2H3W1_UNCEI|nr:S8 family serine peptidase [Candidatus Eisenbacteria bacterium]
MKLRSLFLTSVALTCVLALGCENTTSTDPSNLTVSLQDHGQGSGDPGLPGSKDLKLPDIDDPGVESPEAAGMTVAFNDGSRNSQSMAEQDLVNTLQLVSAHQISTGSGLRIALLDTGVDPNHSLLQGRIVAGRDMIDQDDEPWESADNVDNDGDGLIDEGFGHGTHLAGLVALLAPDAEIHIYRVLDDEGRGKANRVAQAISRAMRAEVDIISLSLGMDVPFAAVEAAIQLADERGVTVLASIGNHGTDLESHFPANYPLVIAVGSHDMQHALSDFSSFGPGLHVTAPGEDLVSAYPDEGYSVMSGTSTSTAVVASLCALILDLNPDFTPQDVADHLAATVNPGTGVPGSTGHGSINFLGAVQP